MRDLLRTVLEELSAGRRCGLATVVRASGSTPRTAGARLLLRADGSTLGSIGGGAFEAIAIADLRDLLDRSEPEPAVKRYTFTETGKDALGMACGGTAEVLLEVIDAGPRLVLFGAGHVGLAVSRLAVRVGFRPQLVDDRAEACEAARVAGVGEVYRCDADWSSGFPPPGPDAFVAVVTRCHRTDRLALRTALAVPFRWIGLIGSRRKREVIFRELREEDGIASEILERVQCPIGLPIGGETPEEIAVSIVAQLVEVRNRP